jgi:hypothetical protein
MFQGVSAESTSAAEYPSGPFRHLERHELETLVGPAGPVLLAASITTVQGHRKLWFNSKEVR